MTNANLFKSLLLIALFVVAGSSVMAQETTSETPQPVTAKQGDFRTTALRQLGLTRPQLQRIRTLNQERKPLMDVAQLRLRQANRALDEMIYADNASDTDVQARLKDFQSAQAEVAKIRFMNELGVRRILTPEQLVRFRQLRDRFEQTRASNNRDASGSKALTQAPERPIQKLLRQNLSNRKP